MHIYCITSRPDENERTEHQWLRVKDNISSGVESIVLVDPIRESSAIFEYYTDGKENDYEITSEITSEIARFATHLKVMRMFLEDVSSSERGGIICECSALFPKDFDKTITYLSDVLNDNKDVDLVALHFDYDGQRFKNLMIYWISRTYAIECLSKYDGSFENPKEQHISLFSNLAQNVYYRLTDIDKVNSILTNFRHSGKGKESMRVAETPFHLIKEGIIEVDNCVLSRFLDEYYIAAFYQDQNLAREIATFYINKAKIDKSFYDAFCLTRDHIQKNFSYTGMKVPDWPS